MLLKFKEYQERKQKASFFEKGIKCPVVFAAIVTSQHSGTIMKDRNRVFVPQKEKNHTKYLQLGKMLSLFYCLSVCV
jgi:hypothetical protein